MDKTINLIIKNMFARDWYGHLENAPIDEQRKQLHKTIRDQVAGYWSGHTAYHLAVRGGFIIDAKRAQGKGKELTELGRMFMAEMEFEQCSITTANQLKGK